MRSRERLMVVLSVLVLVVGSGSAFAAWTDYLQTKTFYEGDSFGTAVADIYVDQANPSSNFEGSGLNLKWADGAERPGYVRFDNIFSNIPAGSFITKATMTLTASAPSTTPGRFKVGTKGGANFSEAATFNTLSWRSGVRGGYFDQLYSKEFGGSLTTGAKVEVDIAPAIRAYFDNYQDSGKGYPNWGVAMNINPVGAGGAGGTVSFYDSENATASNRPQLTIEYLPPTAPYKAVMYLPGFASATPQVMPVTMQDALIQGQNHDQGTASTANLNYGGNGGGNVLNIDWYNGPAGAYNSSSSGLFRWSGLARPEGSYLPGIVDAMLKTNATDFWNVYNEEGAKLEVREALRPWVEGTGYGTVVASGATYNSYDGVNLWQTSGGRGALDSTVLLTSLNSRADGEILLGSGNAALKSLVQNWLDGVGTNNGLLLRMYGAGAYEMFGNILPGTGGDGHRDPYLSAGLMVVYEVNLLPEPASLALLALGGLAIVIRRRS